MAQVVKIKKAGQVVGYRARYRTPDGRQRQKDFKAEPNLRGQLRLRAARDAADHYLSEVAVEKATGAYVDPSRTRTLYAAWAADHWWPGRPSKRPSTLARDKSILDVHLLPHFGHMRLEQIDHLTVRQWVADMISGAASTCTKGRGLAPATVGKAHQLLSESLATAVAAQYLKANPCAGVKIPTVTREEMRFLDPKEIARLVDAMPEQYRALVLVLAYGGLRIGEAAGLRVARCDPLRGTVQIAETLSEVQGHLVASNVTKTEAGKRTVTLPRPVADALAHHITTTEVSGSDYVFTAPAGGPFRLNSWRRRVWTPALATAGLEGLRVHDLRHTAISLWIATGANLLEVSRRAGHTKSSFTLDRYGHLFPNADADLAARLDAVFVGAAPTAPVVPITAAVGPMTSP